MHTVMTLTDGNTDIGVEHENDSHQKAAPYGEISDSPLLRLPGELRNMIYEYILKVPWYMWLCRLGEEYYKFTFPYSRQLLAVTETCRQIREETQDVAAVVRKCAGREATLNEITRLSELQRALQNPLTYVCLLGPDLRRPGMIPFKDFPPLVVSRRNLIPTLMKLGTLPKLTKLIFILARWWSRSICDYMKEDEAEQYRAYIRKHVSDTVNPSKYWQERMKNLRYPVVLTEVEVLFYHEAEQEYDLLAYA